MQSRRSHIAVTHESHSLQDANSEFADACPRKGCTLGVLPGSRGGVVELLGDVAPQNIVEQPDEIMELWNPASDWEGVLWASDFSNLSGVKSVRQKPSILTPYGTFPPPSCTIALWLVVGDNSAAAGKVCSSHGEACSGQYLPS